MKKIYLLFVMLTLALGVFAQSKGKNAMTLRLVDIKVTDGTLVNIAKEQEAKGNTKPMDMIRIYEGNVRAKLDEVAKASGRFEISDENALEALTRGCRGQSVYEDVQSGKDRVRIFQAE